MEVDEVIVCKDLNGKLSFLFLYQGVLRSAVMDAVTPLGSVIRLNYKRKEEKSESHKASARVSVSRLDQDRVSPKR